MSYASPELPRQPLSVRNFFWGTVPGSMMGMNSGVPLPGVVPRTTSAMMPN